MGKMRNQGPVWREAAGVSANFTRSAEPVPAVEKTPRGYEVVIA